MATSAPRPIPTQSDPNYTSMPFVPPQPGYPSHPPPGQVNDPRANAGAPIQPTRSRASSYNSTAPPQPGYGAVPPQGYGNTPPQAYGTTPPQGYYGTTPPRAAMPPQSYSYGAPAPHPAFGTTPPQGYGPAPSQFAYQPPNPEMYPQHLHPADAYAGRPRGATTSSTSSGGYHDRRRSYDPGQLSDGYDEERRRRRSDGEVARRRERRRKRREAEDLERRPTVGDSAMWAWGKVSGALGGGR